VRGDDDVASRYPAAVGLCAEWPFGQLIDRAVLEQQPAEPDDRTSETRQILPRMKLGLMIEADARAMDTRNIVDECGVKTKFQGK